MTKHFTACAKWAQIHEITLTYISQVHQHTFSKGETTHDKAKQNLCKSVWCHYFGKNGAKILLSYCRAELSNFKWAPLCPSGCAKIWYMMWYDVRAVITIKGQQCLTGAAVGTVPPDLCCVFINCATRSLLWTRARQNAQIIQLKYAAGGNLCSCMNLYLNTSLQSICASQANEPKMSRLQRMWVARSFPGTGNNSCIPWLDRWVKPLSTRGALCFVMIKGLKVTGLGYRSQAVIWDRF